MGRTSTRGGPDWLGGAVVGLVAAVLVGLGLWAVDPAVVEAHVPEALGASGAAVGLVVLAGIGVVLGLVYAGLATVAPIGRYAARPRTAGVVGLGFGLVVWLVAIVVVPIAIGEGVDAIGEVAATVRAAVAFGLLGALVGTGSLLWRVRVGR